MGCLSPRRTATAVVALDDRSSSAVAYGFDDVANGVEAGLDLFVGHHERRAESQDAVVAATAPREDADAGEEVEIGVAGGGFDRRTSPSRSRLAPLSGRAPPTSPGRAGVRGVVWPVSVFDPALIFRFRRSRVTGSTDWEPLAVPRKLLPASGP